MFILGNILVGLAQVLNLFLQLYMFIVFGRVIISWVNADPRNPIVQFLWKATEPLFRRVRRWFPWLANLSGLDLTPIAILAIVFLLQHAVVNNLLMLGERLQ